MVVVCSTSSESLVKEANPEDPLIILKATRGKCPTSCTGLVGKWGFRNLLANKTSSALLSVKRRLRAARQPSVAERGVTKRSRSSTELPAAEEPGSLRHRVAPVKELPAPRGAEQ